MTFDIAQELYLSYDLTAISDYIDHSLIQNSGLATASDKRKKEFSAGRIAGKKALEKININTNFIPRSESGVPIWPDGYCGSISHSDTHALAVVAETRYYLSIGVDIELMSTKNQLSQLRGQFLRPEEDEVCTQEQALIVFSAKEALYKMVFPLTQKYFGFHSARMNRFDKDFVTLSLTENVAIFPRGSEFKVLYHYQCDHIVCMSILKLRSEETCL